MLEILAHLCEQGGDPTCVSTQGKTAKGIAHNRDNKIAATLLGMYFSSVCYDAPEFRAIYVQKYLKQYTVM